MGRFLLTLLKSVLLQFVKNFILRISLKERAKFKVLIKVVFFDSFIILSKIRVSAICFMKLFKLGTTHFLNPFFFQNVF